MKPPYAMSSKNKVRLRKVGETQEGTPVIGDVYRFCETHGVPLEDVVDILHEKGVLVDWLDYARTALKAGMKLDRVLSRVDVAACDAYGPDHRDVVISRLRKAFA